MQNKFPSLITSNADAGLVLAGQLADQLQAQIEKAGANLECPGGMSYLRPAPVPREITISVLFYTIAAANGGWPVKG
jgi:hypothetical protein